MQRTNRLLCAVLLAALAPALGAKERQSPADDMGFDVKKSLSGVVCVITKHGSGQQLRSGEIVSVNLTQLEGENAVRQANWLWLLADRQPAGLLEAMGLLHVGDSAVIVVPPSLGRSPIGQKEIHTAVTTYVVELLDVKSRDLFNTIAEIVDKKGIEAGADQYREWKKRGFPDFFTGEKQMTGLGYLFLRKGDLNDAIDVFRFVVTTYSSANSYDSLGEAYAANGQKDLAIENYKKALSIEPGFKSSIEALQKLTQQQ